VEQADLKLWAQYVLAIEKALAAGDATEHTHRPALKTLLESLAEEITATNEPKHIECGAPDFILRKGSVAVGYIEAKDIGKSLDEVEKSEQLNRYRDSLTNLVLTDYLEFRWYVDGECRLKARLGSPTKDGKIRRDREGVQRLAELFNNFLSHKAVGVGTPRELARRMARQTHLIRNLIINAFKNEPEGGSLHTQLVAFRDNLIPDLSAEYFADMYAQTIAYGLFAARCTHPDENNFIRQNAAYLLPKTNPFLRKLFNTIAGPDLDERITWLVDDLAQVLAQADMEAVLKDFGKHSGKEDAVVHFYETFLKEYDEKIREMRGVYYTPEPVVSYIVRSIDHLLKTRFNKPQGLADDKTLILDPAVGTATFLYMVVNEIYQANTGKRQQGLWNNYVAEKLLPRIFGFELLMAPYAVAHLKLGLLLQGTGYEFRSDQRLGIYLTNTLDEAIKHSETLFAQWIIDESNAAAEIKKEKQIMVVLGNPPYSGHSANASTKKETMKAGTQYWKRINGKWEWVKAKSNITDIVPTFIGRILDDYYQVDGKPLGEKNPKWLQDDYVKFIRFGQWRIERTGQGVLGFITNHAYLDNPTFRGMRQSLMNTFTDIYILNLHGNAKKKEVAPDGGKDENVFDIQQGVAICLLVKKPDETAPARIHYADLWGLREGKYLALLGSDIATTSWAELNPTSSLYLFVPREEAQVEEYEKGWKVTDIFPVNSVGLFTARDHFVVDFNENSLENRIEEFRGTDLSDDEIQEKYELKDSKGWRLASARQNVRLDSDYSKAFTTCLYRPFDIRPFFYHKSVIERSRSKFMRHLLDGENLAICIGRAGQVVGPAQWDIVYCGRQIVDLNIFYRGGGQCFPIYLYPAEGEMQFEGGKRRPNLNPEFIKAFSGKLGLTFIEDGRGELKQTFGPEDIFNYAYAVFHSPTYRTRYAEFLKIDFPRLPLTSDKELFKVLAAKGAELVSLHLMESPALNSPITNYPIAGSNAVEKVTYDDNNQRVYINKTQYLGGVPPDVWDSHIGGYQVAQKWLKDRKGRTLTYDELTNYQKVIVALKETIRLMEEIDEIIPEWPLV
jgi:predicted helicase